MLDKNYGMHFMYLFRDKIKGENPKCIHMYVHFLMPQAGSGHRKSCCIFFNKMIRFNGPSFIYVFHE